MSVSSIAKNLFPLFLIALILMPTPAMAHYLYTYTSDGIKIINAGETLTNADLGRFTPDASIPATHIYHALFFEKDNDVSITNNADFTANFTGLNVPQFIYIASSAGPATIINNGSVTMTSADTSARGLVIIPANSSITNNGSISISHVDSHGAGIYAVGADTTITNTGTITATRNGAGFNFTRMTGIETSTGNNIKVNNSGTISVQGAPSSITPTTESSCIRAGSAGGEITNTGMLLTSGQAYEVSVWRDTKFVGTYNITLDNDPNLASIKVGHTHKLDLNNAVLTVSSVPDTKFNTDYKVFEDKNNNVIGNFSDVISKHPDAKAVYTRGATRDGDTVKLLYTPKASTPNISTEVAELSIMNSVNVVQNRMAANAMIQSLGLTIIADNGNNDKAIMVAEASNTVSDASGGLFSKDDSPKGSMFVMPYGSWARSTRSPMGYEATMGGLSLGYEFSKGDTVFGFHGGVGQANIDFTGEGYTRNTEHQKLYTLGIHGGTTFDNWVLGASATPFTTHHDFHGMTGANLDVEETAFYDSYGTVNRILGGYRFTVDNNVFMPTLGLTHFWMHREDYTTDADGRAWDTSYGSMDDNELQAALGLRWMRKIEMDGFTLVPSLMASLRQTLTDGTTTTSQTVPGAPSVNVNSKSDKKALDVEAFTSFIFDDWTLQVGYSGERSEKVIEHGAWFRAKWDF